MDSTVRQLKVIDMSNKIAQRRVEDSIRWFSETDFGEVEVAVIFDGQPEISIDPAAKAIFGVDVAAYFSAAGVTPETARLIDAMPVPNEQ